ncbi:MAG TPA: hypothetical protein PK530_22580, partial [Anaerolineales bacterium]|nr:hypothetical protein [Anaerolineales bacterium]
MPPPHFTDDPHQNWPPRPWQRGPWRGRPGVLFFRLLFGFGFLTLVFLAFLILPFLIFKREGPMPMMGPDRSFWLLSCLFAFFLLGSFGWGVT